MIILYFLCANVNTLFYLYKSLWKKLQKKAVFYFVLSKTCTTFALKKKNKQCHNHWLNASDHATSTNT